MKERREEKKKERKQRKTNKQKSRSTLRLSKIFCPKNENLDFDSWTSGFTTTHGFSIRAESQSSSEERIIIIKKERRARWKMKVALFGHAPLILLHSGDAALSLSLTLSRSNLAHATRPANHSDGASHGRRGVCGGSWSKNKQHDLKFRRRWCQVSIYGQRTAKSGVGHEAGEKTILAFLSCSPRSGECYVELDIFFVLLFFFNLALLIFFVNLFYFFFLCFLVFETFYFFSFSLKK